MLCLDLMIMLCLQPQAPDVHMFKLLLIVMVVIWLILKADIWSG